MIKQQTVDKVLETARIEDVVGDFVPLRKRGINLIGVCPFHNERTPSFNVNPTRNIFKCFGCGEAGDSVSFLMKHENFNFTDSIKWLANRYNIEIEETAPSAEFVLENLERESLYGVLEFAQKWYSEQLLNTDMGKSVGLSYFKERGLSVQSIEKWGLGYAPEGFDTFTNHALGKLFKLDFLVKGGLSKIYENDKKADFFRSRVMFPILNLSGKTVGFGGRKLTADPKVPKYINSSESDIYNKSKLLFGGFQAKNSIRKLDECLLTEGYLDVITLHEAGIENVVAASGTSLTVEQLQIIKRFTPNLTILLDGDTAGVKAALRGFELALGQDLNVRAVLIPNGEDPDSYLRKVGTEVFKQYVKEHAQDYILFSISLEQEKIDKDPLFKTKFLKEIARVLAKIQDPLKRSVLTQAAAQRMRIDEAILAAEIDIYAHENIKQFLRREENQHKKENLIPENNLTDEERAELEHYLQIENENLGSKKTKEHYQERDIVRILIEFGERELTNDGLRVADHILNEIKELIEEFENFTYKDIIAEAFENYQKGIILGSNHWVSHKNTEIKKFASDVLTSPYHLSHNWEDKFDMYLQSQEHPEKNHFKDTLSAINRFKLVKVEQLRFKNQEKLKDASITTEELILILKIQVYPDELRAKLAELTGTVVLR